MAGMTQTLGARFVGNRQKRRGGLHLAAAGRGTRRPASVRL